MILRFSLEKYQVACYIAMLYTTLYITDFTIVNIFFIKYIFSKMFTRNNFVL